MKNYHITTRVALVLDLILFLHYIIQQYTVPQYGAWVLSIVLGIVALFLCTIGQRWQSAKLGIVLIVINIICSLGLEIITQYTLVFMVEKFYVSIPSMLLFLVVQFSIYVKGTRMEIQYVPIYIIIAASIIAGLMAVMIVAIENFAAFVLSIYLGAFIVIPGLIGVAVAWAIYEIYKKNYPRC